jgi:hypothetical protein
LQAKLLELELKKAFDEIQARINNMDSWYHWKFLLVGGLLAIFISKELFPRFNESKPQDKMSSVVIDSVLNDRPLVRAKSIQRQDMTKPTDHDMRPAIALVFAISCIVSLAADIHIRIDGTMTGMIGRWIADYVEPHSANSKLFFWESFIRQSDALHTSFVTQITFAPHLHFLTWPLYMMYLWFFQSVALNSTRLESHQILEQKGLVKGSFVIVHFSLLAFVVVAHSTPYAYDLTVMDSVDPQEWLAACLLLWTFFVGCSLPYFGMLFRNERGF